MGSSLSKSLSKGLLSQGQGGGGMGGNLANLSRSLTNAQSAFNGGGGVPGMPGLPGQQQEDPLAARQRMIMELLMKQGGKF